jgi:glycine/D-amino acid oxidase-like deaminating enzyme
MFRSAPEHIDSYFAVSSRAHQQRRPALAESRRFDVCVVGAGYFGLHTALELARAGKHVAVLEASRIGWGASGRNGGQLNPGFACGMQTLQDAMGPQRAAQLFDASRTALREIRALVQQHAIDCDLADGHLEVAVLARRVADLRRRIEECAQQWGYAKLRFIDKAELPGYLCSDRYQAAVFDPEAAHLHPLKFALGLARAAEAHGASIFERSRVLGYRESPAHIEVAVESAGGVPPICLRCDQIVLAANAYLDRVDPRLARRVLPVGTFIGVTQVLGEQRARSLIPQNHAVYDNQFILEYFRLTADHRLLFGGRCTYLGGTPARLPQAMKRNMLRAFPGLADVSMEYAWGGHIDITMRRTPDWGRRHDRVFWAQGFCGHGIVPARVAARLVAEAVLGKPAQLDWFASIRNPPFFGGAALGGLMQAAGMAYYRLRDFF